MANQTFKRWDGLLAVGFASNEITLGIRSTSSAKCTDHNASFDSSTLHSYILNITNKLWSGITTNFTYKTRNELGGWSNLSIQYVSNETYKIVQIHQVLRKTLK